jgi:tetratricopeptide (TPR) repeat protein
MTIATRILLAISSLVLATGCATAPPVPAAPPATDLFSDSLFQAPAQPIRTDQLFALSAPMRAHLNSIEFRNQLSSKGPQRGLFDALYKKGDLKLEYDAAVTRDAAGTFAAGKGNCLSLIIMTAAFAKALNIETVFQAVEVEEQWSRNGNIYVASTHVNLSLPMRGEAIGSHIGVRNSLTIDFVPPDEAAHFFVQPIDELKVTAMFLNNRAAEALAANRLDEAYWYARTAIDKNPAYTVAYNTLGVIYQRHGDYALAERVYKRALEREREDTIVMHNLVPVLAKLGKVEESKELATRLASIEPVPPFYYFQKGVKAMEEGRYQDARTMFAREVKRSPYYHEFHFWLGLAYLRLGETYRADAEMKNALETSTTASATKLYSAKLAYLRSMATDARKRAY